MKVPLNKKFGHVKLFFLTCLYIFYHVSEQERNTPVNKVGPGNLDKPSSKTEKTPKNQLSSYF